MGFDNGFGVEHPNAEPAAFGGLEGTKEGTLHKITGHAAAAIRNRELDAILPERSGNSNLAIAIHRFPRVEDEVSDYLAELFRVSGDFGERVQIS